MENEQIILQQIKIDELQQQLNFYIQKEVQEQTDDQQLRQSAMLQVVKSELPQVVSFLRKHFKEHLLIKSKLQQGNDQKIIQNQNISEVKEQAPKQEEDCQNLQINQYDPDSQVVQLQNIVIDQQREINALYDDKINDQSAIELLKCENSYLTKQVAELEAELQQNTDQQQTFLNQLQNAQIDIKLLKQQMQTKDIIYTNQNQQFRQEIYTLQQKLFADLEQKQRLEAKILFLESK